MGSLSSVDIRSRSRLCWLLEGTVCSEWSRKKGQQENQTHLHSRMGRYAWWEPENVTSWKLNNENLEPFLLSGPGTRLHTLAREISTETAGKKALAIRPKSSKLLPEAHCLRDWATSVELDSISWQLCYTNFTEKIASSPCHNLQRAATTVLTWAIANCLNRCEEAHTASYLGFWTATYADMCSPKRRPEIDKNVKWKKKRKHLIKLKSIVLQVKL